MDNPLENQIQELKRKGVKATVARRAVLEVLLEGPSHQSADDIATKVSSRYPEIHLSTVYRTLETLEGIGAIDHVHLGHGRAVYHLGDEPHQHLVCDRCGSVTEVPNEIFSPLNETLSKRYGFHLRRNHFAVLGRCSSCENSTSQTSVRTYG